MDPVSLFKAYKEFLLFAAYLMLVKVLLSSTVSISPPSPLQTHTRLEKLDFSCNQADYWSDALPGYRVSTCN